MEVVLVLIGMVLAFLGFRAFKQKRDEADRIKEVKHKEMDARLEERQSNRNKRLLELQKKMEEARKEGRNLSEEDIERFWNND